MTYAIAWGDGSTTVIGSDRVYAEQLLREASGPFPASQPRPSVIEINPTQQDLHHRAEGAPPMTTLTPEQFLAQRDPEEPDEPETSSGFTAPIGDPLESIAHSLHRLTEIFVRRDHEDLADDEHKQALDQLDREYAELQAEVEAKQQLIDDTLKICKKSTSKLADSIRALLEAPAAPPSSEPGRASGNEADVPPDNDADVEEWREYARSCGVLPDEPDAIDSMNRSQIRTLLGIEHGGEA